jgi:cleavage and polyadenylation specificity factor subunit 3
MATPHGAVGVGSSIVGSSRKRTQPFDGDAELVEFKPLGSGREVGRSCHLLQLKGKTILLDCGIHPAYTGSAALPFLDEIEIGDIDLVLISHFHLDHIGALPYLLRHPDFKGDVYMTHPTRAIYRLIMEDFLKVSSSSASNVTDSLFTMKDVIETISRIKCVNFHSTTLVKGIRFRPYHAGHVLGAAMFHIEVGDTKLLYTGDYSRTEDRHLVAAEVPDVKPDILVVEATHGGLVLPSRQQEERTFGQFIHRVVKRGGKCLIPQFALGRIQELLLIIEDYWETHAALHDVPIYYASDLARRSMDVYKTYVNVMNETMRAAAAVRNPFEFKHIISATSAMHIDQSGPCVVFASPGMLTGGLALQLFDQWSHDRRNGVMIAGYNVEGTLAYELLHSPPQFHRTTQGTSHELLMEIGGVSMSNHADSKETVEFVRQVQPSYCILVHGNPIGMRTFTPQHSHLCPLF